MKRFVLRAGRSLACKPLVASVTTPKTTQHKPKTGSRKWDKKTKDKKI